MVKNVEKKERNFFIAEFAVVFLHKKKTQKRNFFSIFSNISRGEKQIFSLPEICEKNEKNPVFFQFFWGEEWGLKTILFLPPPPQKKN